jgi:hypothetical protein
MIGELWAAGRKLLHSSRFYQGKFFKDSGHFLPAPYPDTLVARKTLATEKEDMTRTDAIARARQQLHSGEFLAELDRRVAYSY